MQRVVVDVPGPEFEPKPPRVIGGTSPDLECDGWSTPAVTLRSASVRGDRHRYYGQPRQDATCAVVHEGTGAVVFAVADGLSSAAASAVGAAEACRSAVWTLLTQLDAGRTDFTAAARHAADALHRQASVMLQRPEVPLPQVEELVATTLVAGTARPTAEGVEVALFRIGDSAAWFLDGRHFHPLFTSKEEDGLVATGVTALPRLPDPLDQWYGRLHRGHVLLVGTDGFGDPLGDGDGQVGAMFADNLAVPPTPLRLAHLLDFSRETFDDDRTLLALWPRSEAR
ncbi:MAG: hypothetical protein HOY71_30550 [Nonomuraea sp.]|nr:hypothetical protein [Nonomuraea sp.]